LRGARPVLVLDLTAGLRAEDKPVERVRLACRVEAAHFQNALEPRGNRDATTRFVLVFWYGRNIVALGAHVTFVPSMSIPSTCRHCKLRISPRRIPVSRAASTQARR